MKTVVPGLFAVFCPGTSSSKEVNFVFQYCIFVFSLNICISCWMYWDFFLNVITEINFYYLCWILVMGAILSLILVKCWADNFTFYVWKTSGTLFITIVFQRKLTKFVISTWGKEVINFYTIVILFSLVVLWLLLVLKYCRDSHAESLKTDVFTALIVIKRLGDISPV